MPSSVFTLNVVEGHEECRESCLVFTEPDPTGFQLTGVRAQAHTRLKSRQTPRDSLGFLKSVKISNITR